MATITIHPRQTPEERADTQVEVEIDEALSIFAATLEDWVAPRQNWELELREGHEFGRANNVEARLLFVAGEQTSTLSFGSSNSTPPMTPVRSSCCGSRSATGSRSSRRAAPTASTSSCTTS